MVEERTLGSLRSFFMPISMIYLIKQEDDLHIAVEKVSNPGMASFTIQDPDGKAIIVLNDEEIFELTGVLIKRQSDFKKGSW